MERSTVRRRRRFPYWVVYTGITTLLLALTGFLVLIVLPERFVLQAGLRESGISFPASTLGFGPPARSPVVEPPPPPPRPVAPAIGPAEALWSELTPLLRVGRYHEALARMEDYLAVHPGDLGVRRERARTLAGTGDRQRASEALGRLADEPGELQDGLALARFIRDAGELSEAVEIYRTLVDRYPDDADLRYELAQALMWSERYREAEAEFRALIRLRPTEDVYRLELARVLYWTDRLEEARSVLAAISPEAESRMEADALDAELVTLLAPVEPEPEPVDQSPLARARRAAAAGELQLAAELYREALQADSGDAVLWLEWIDFQQRRLGDLEGARDALIAYDGRFGLSPELGYRLALLHTWTERNEEARLILLRLLETSPNRAEAWSLLGDVYRWSGERPAAAGAYRRALVLDPADPRALAGAADLGLQRERIVAARERRGYGPRASAYGDSDEYRRFELEADARLAFPRSSSALRVATGYRWLEGLDVSGVETTDDGPYTEAELIHWWREATIRTALRAGVQYLRGFGLEPSFGLDVEVPDAGGFGLLGTLEHAPAYPLTATLESVQQPVRADRLFVSLFRSLGERWSVGGTADVAVLTHTEANNIRWGGRLTLGWNVSRRVVGELSSSYLSYTDAAPRSALRGIYWDPASFWATTLSLGLRERPELGWGYGVMLTGGAALMDERSATGTVWVPQFAVEGMLSHTGRRQDFELRAFYRRGRERDYSSLGLDLKLLVRP
jgi:Flp pilus assembly protein TadD